MKGTILLTSQLFHFWESVLLRDLNKYFNMYLDILKSRVDFVLVDCIPQN